MIPRIALLAVIVLCACGGAGVSPPASFESAGDDTPARAPVARAAPTELRAATEPPPLANASAPGARSLAAFPVFTDPGDLPSLAIVETGKPPAERRKLPLKETRVTAQLAQFVAEVEVTQRYENTEHVPIEAVFVFPLPENAAVNRMKMVVGDRVVEAKIDERTRARKTYEAAKKEGFTAALLEEERPNVFTQSVANVQPGKPIEVTLRYVQDLSYDAGVHEFVFPMVVGPRFVQGAALDRAPSGTGTHADTDAVPDASRVTPPYMGKGERSGRDISIEIVTVPNLFIGKAEAVTHDVRENTDEAGRVHLTLSPKDRVPNRDFVLRYKVASETPRATMLLSGKDDGFFSLVLDPPELDVDGLVGKREIVFVVDVSGSMSGAPLALCKRAMRLALEKIRPVDTFNVISFSGRTERLFRSSRAANNVNVREAVDFVDRMTAGGGTMMLDAVADALSPDVEAGRDRYVFFLTDGFVSVEDQILSSTRRFVSEMEKKGRKAKVFGFGVSSSPNRALIEGMSREGKGVAVYATMREDPDRAVNQFFRYIDRSVLRDVSIDWGGAKVSDVSPSALPDLFASHPLIVHGRFTGTPSRRPVMHATSAVGPIEIPVEVVPVRKDERRDVLGTLWARSKIGALEADLASGDQTAQASITKLGLDFQIVTRFTSFIAVDRSSKSAEGPAKQVVQPSEIPEGVKQIPTGPGPSTQQGQQTPPGLSPSPPKPPPDRDGDGVQDEPKETILAGGRAPPPAEADYRNRGCACTFAGADPNRDFGGLIVVFVGLAAMVSRLRWSTTRNVPKPSSSRSSCRTSATRSTRRTSRSSRGSRRRSAYGSWAGSIRSARTRGRGRSSVSASS